MFRIRLRSFLFFLAFVILAISVSSWIYRSLNQKFLADELAQNGVNVHYTFQLDSDPESPNGKVYPDSVPKFLIDSLGHDFFCDLGSIRYGHSSPNEKYSELLLQRKLRVLSFNDNEISRDSFGFLPLNLECLTISSDPEDLAERLRPPRTKDSLFARQINNAFLDRLYDDENSISAENPFESIDRFKSVRRLPNLRKLHINYLANQKEAAFISKHRTLTDLTIENCGLLADFQFLGQLRKIKSLRLYSCHEFDLKNLKGMKDLEKLIVSGTIKKGSQVHLPKNVKVLHLQWPELCDLTFMNRLTKLKEVFISCETIESWPDLQLNTNLQQIELQDAEFESLTPIGKTKSLNSLKLTDCNVLSHKSFNKLVNLRNLKIENCYFNAESLADLPALKRLEVNRGKPPNLDAISRIPNLIFFRTDHIFRNEILTRFFSKKPEVSFSCYLDDE